MEEDFSNYSATVEEPVHTIYRGTPSPIAMQLQGKVLFTSQGVVTALTRAEVKAVLKYLQKVLPGSFLLFPADTDASWVIQEIFSTLKCFFP